MAGRRIVVEFLGKDTSLGKTADQTETKLGRLGGKFKEFGAKAGPALAGGALVAGAAMVKFGQQASDLSETQSKVRQIFKGDSIAIAQLGVASKQAAKELGMSQQAYLDAAATFGVIGKGAGLTGAKLQGFSQKMVDLAGDMASFSNTSPQEAIEAIGAGLRGESEPLRRFGVLLDDATLRQAALKMGLIKTTKDALTPQQKALAAQNVILAQTKDQQGDFARTSNGLANKQRILKAEFENLTTQLGQKALPIMLKVTDWAMKAINWMEKHQTLIKGIAAVVVPLIAGLYALAKAQALLNLVMTANPVGLVIVAIAALAAGLIYAYKKSQTFRDIVKGTFDAVGKACFTMWNSVIRPVLKLWINTWLSVVGALVNGAAKAFGWVPGIGPKLKKAADLFNDFKTKVNNQLDGIKDKKVKITTPGADEAIGRLKTLNNLLNVINNKKQVKVNVATPGMYNPGTTKPGKNARGTNNWRGGLTWVGERGPELLDLPRGSRITPNNKATAQQPIIINISGALDPVAVGRQLEQVLTKYARTTGRPLSFV